MRAMDMGQEVAAWLVSLVQIDELSGGEVPAVCGAPTSFASIARGETLHIFDTVLNARQECVVGVVTASCRDSNHFPVGILIAERVEECGPHRPPGLVTAQEAENQTMECLVIVRRKIPGEPREATQMTNDA